MGYGKVSYQYQKTNIATASKVGLVVLCYEKTIQSLTLARMSYEQKEFEAKANALEKAIRIINELQSSLDKEKGGVIAENLDSIYSFVTRRLLEGDIKEDLTAFDDCIHILSELKDAWEVIASEGTEKNDPVAASISINTGATQVAA